MEDNNGEEEVLTVDPNKKTFRKELTELLNRYSRENHSDTSDFLLAEYIEHNLDTFDWIVKKRDQWYGQERGNGARINTPESHRIII